VLLYIITITIYKIAIKAVSDAAYVRKRYTECYTMSILMLNFEMHKSSTVFSYFYSIPICVNLGYLYSWII